MNYFICQNWKNTAGNHAGMLHFCSLIKELDTSNVKYYSVLDIKLKGRVIRPLNSILYFFLAIYLAVRVNKGDKVFLMEYLLTSHNQYIVARVLRFFNTNVEIRGIAHLVSQRLDKMFEDRDLHKWCDALDYIITFGNSLTNYLKERGICSQKIITTHHYVDNKFFSPTLKPQGNTLKVLIMGNMQRDFKTTIDIIKNTEGVHFYFLTGLIDIGDVLDSCNNVTVYGYIEEEELKCILNESDISLSAMYDTIGSNAITISMAMELAMVVSDVGSIRDYCDKHNAIFCENNTCSFVNALQTLDSNRELLTLMKIRSRIYAENFSVSKIYQDLIQ